MSSNSTTTAPAFPWVGLLVLAGAIFVSVTSEFLPTGLLPDMASELEVSESRIGLLVTIFAGTVVVSTTPLAALTRRYSRKYLVVIVLLVVATGNVLAALAPTYEILVGARIIGGLAHGLFWAVVGAYAAHLVPKHQIGRAVAITSGGGTAAFVLGVPLGTALGHALGWRLAFATIGVIVIVLAILVLRFLPAVDHRVPLATGEIPMPLRKDRSIPGVIVLCFVIIVVMTGHNLFYTYIAPWLISVGGFGEDSIAILLFLFGGAGAVGLVLAGLVSDRFPRGGMIVATTVVAVSVLVMALWSGSQVVIVASLVVWGIAFGGLPAMLQTRMLHTASARMRDLAAALFTTSFNFAIGFGALVGGLLLDQAGIITLPFVDVVIIAVGVVFMVVSNLWLSARAKRARIA
ncbi:MFS transporter [Conyzicola nivalis]|uniref:MFS transporter n=1 Tax=Conyzicola nivalis TaxID=1477021 RepID=A0A916STE0_9MICO|nr:MFS transporter [Conyzicola nivalis]GGB12694.1 MFS transporter [Conyzicola nivalis]